MYYSNISTLDSENLISTNHSACMQFERFSIFSPSFSISIWKICIPNKKLLNFSGQNQGYDLKIGSWISQKYYHFYGTKMGASVQPTRNLVCIGQKLSTPLFQIPENIWSNIFLISEVIRWKHRRGHRFVSIRLFGKTESRIRLTKIRILIANCSDIVWFTIRK